MAWRWGAGIALAMLVGGWAGNATGSPATVAAQSTGSSSSASGTSVSEGGSGGDGTSTSAGSGDRGSGDTGSSGAREDEPGVGNPATTATGAPTTSPPSAQGDVVDADETDCGREGSESRRCYHVDGAAGVDGLRVPDGRGGVVVVPIAAVPVVDVDTGASTSASSNVDLDVEVDVRTGEVIRVERSIDPFRQAALATFAGLFGVLVGAAVLGTYVRVRHGPR